MQRRKGCRGGRDAEEEASKDAAKLAGGIEMIDRRALSLAARMAVQ